MHNGIYNIWHNISVWMGVTPPCGHGLIPSAQLFPCDFQNRLCEHTSCEYVKTEFSDLCHLVCWSCIELVKDIVLAQQGMKICSFFRCSGRPSDRLKSYKEYISVADYLIGILSWHGNIANTVVGWSKFCQLYK